MTVLNATYSPEDNKLRIYTSEKLDLETYLQAKEIGFKYANKQKLYVAPKWTPAREDFCLKLAGEIIDEESTLEERAAARAERFEGYEINRVEDAENFQSYADSLSEQFAMGQPILKGHYSEKKARKDQERIHRSMDKSIKNYKTAEYWADRAKSSLIHAARRHKPGVRIRRINGLEAEKRKYQRYLDNHEKCLKLWSTKDMIFTPTLIRAIEQVDRQGYNFNPDKYPEMKMHFNHDLPIPLSDALKFISIEKAIDIAIRGHEKNIKYYKRWVHQLELRLAYENSALTQAGHSMPEKPKRPKLPPIINEMLEGVKVITNEEWNKVHKENRGYSKVKTSDEFGAYRQPFIYERWNRINVFISDKKIVKRPVLSEVQNAL